MSAVFWGLLIPFLGTGLGAACVFCLKKDLKRGVQRALTGFAAGVMVAASIWSLIVPAMDQSAALGRWAFLPAFVGFWLGVLFLLLLDHIIPHLHRSIDQTEGPKSRLPRTVMLVLAVTLHNIPEGMAVGVVYAGLISGSANITAGGALALALGIAIQNFPEGAIISMPLYAEGKSKPKAFWLGVLSGAVEPVFGGLTVIVAGLVVPAMPYLLSFAAGAMLYVVVEELIPEMSAGEHSNVGVVAFALGFSLMMALSLAACGSSGSDSRREESKSSPAPEAALTTPTAAPGGPVLGSWTNADQSGEGYTFYDDGTGVYQIVDGVTQGITYRTADGRITITYSPVSSAERNYSVQGDTLQLQNTSGGYKTYAKTSDDATPPREPDDAELAEAAKARLIGTWSYVGLEEVERLTFNEDGTGTYRVFGVPYDLRVLEAAKAGWMNALHAHGTNIMFELLKDYPIDVFNWHAWETLPAVDEAAVLTGKCLMGGLKRGDITNKNRNEILHQTFECYRLTGGIKHILTPGCVVRYPLDKDTLHFVKEARDLVEARVKK